jgi:RHS repeat-associated protein
MKTSITTQSDVQAHLCKATKEKYVKRALLVAALMLFGAQFAYGQRDGVGSFVATDAHAFDVVNLSNLVPSFNIPLISKSGGPLPVSLEIESNQSCVVFQPPHNNGVGTYCGGGAGQLISGLYFIVQPLWGISTNASSSTGGNCTYYGINRLVGIDNLSSWAISTTNLAFPSTCGSTSATVTTTDNTGITATLTAGSGGVTVTAAHRSSGVGFPGTYQINDPFGNGLSVNGTGPYTLTDALGAMTTLDIPIEPTYYGYIDTTGHAQTISLVNGTQTTYQPIGNCGTLNVGTQVTPVSSVSFPDGTSFGFTWDTNNGGIDGLIKSLTLRTGGTITFTYGTVYSCSGGWAYNTLSRTTQDGTTTYSLSYSNGITTTTVLDPGKNKIVYTFFGAPNGQNTGSNPTLMQSVTRYQNTGTVASPVYTLISSTKYCYNNASCNTAPSFPITQVYTYEYAGTGSTQMSHRVQTYDGYGNTLTDSNTDSITGQVKLTTYVYGTYSGTYPNGSCAALGNTKIHNHVCTKTTTVGGTQVAQNIYAYNSNGALTSSIDWLSGTSHLTTNYSPNANGTVASATAPNGQVTTYGYAATGSGGCNGLLQTSSSTTVNSVVISSSKTWDCNGVVVLTTTDPNGNGTVAQYDSMFRPTLTQDQLGNQTSYASTSNSASITDPMNVYRIGYVDNLGRTIISQTKQSPGSSNYDTVSTTYGWNGTNFQTQTSVPCVQTLDLSCPTVAFTALSNPAVGSVSSTNANGGTLTNARNANDISVTAGPAPSGEHVKTSQTEVDGFGRTKSVCAVQISGGTACGQVMGNSGILTSSSYSFGTGSSTVTTTRGAQTHTTVSDAIGRTTSITTPEGGNTSYVYDSDGASGCNTTANGSLVRKNNIDGNFICYYHDGLGRVTSTWTTAGVSGDYCIYLVYDATTNTILTKPSGATLSNLVNHVVEALTTNNDNGQGNGNCPSIPLATANIESDEWFSYDKDGRMTDMWEWTAVGHTYYHTTVVYDGDGVVTSMSGYPNNPTVTYTRDGEDRWNIAKLGTATLVNGVTYDAASRPTQINIGTGTDKDTYSYDNVGNMKQYQFFVGSQNNKGVLTWNSIGSLGSLVITDGFNANNSQTCNYAYDDGARLVTDNCGSVWSQTFGYDQYDNLWQSGSSSFACAGCYNTSNNQYQTLGTTYDSNGNLTKDPAGNTFAYNVYGQLATINGGQEIVYDAFGREVANPSGTQSTEKLYSPMGFVGTLISSGPSNSVIKLPGGGTLNSDGTGGVYYSHMDWLGSARTQSAVSGGLTDDRSFAPYGEVYQTTNQDNPFLFAGTTSFLLAGTLYDTPNRELSAVAGRWNSPDPVHASWNAYSYPTDPNRQNDPTGLDGQSPCAAWGSCELANDHISPLMSRFFAPDSTKYGTDGRPAPWVLSNSNGAQNNNGNQDGGLVYKSTPDSIDIKGLVKSFLRFFGIQFKSTPAADTNTPQEIPLPANLLWIDEVVNGHGWTDHGQEDFSSKQEYKQAILDTVQNAKGKDVQHPDKFRTLFWNDSDGFAVWRDKRHPDQGTGYFPDDPDAFKKQWGLE